MNADNSSQTSAEAHSRESIVRIATAGSVDDGKSTLLGRLLIDCRGVYEDQIMAAQKRSSLARNESMHLALLTDGLKAEREQGITIDVAYRFFSTAKRRFILADTPGHEQYTRNMATGASTADISLLVIDAKKGVTTQTKRHAFISSLLGVPRFVIAVNKMDLVDFSEEVFLKIREEFEEFAARLSIKEIKFIPIAALLGDNVVTRSNNMPWFDGETLLSYFENVYIASDRNLVDFRFPVQTAIRPDSNFRGYAGTLASGRIKVGDDVLVLPQGRKTKVKTIESASLNSDRFLQEAEAGQAVTLTLTDEVDISRGNMIVRPLNAPQVKHDFEAMLIWMHESTLKLKQPYLIKHTTRLSRAFVTDLRYQVNVNNLHRQESSTLEMNQIARVAISSTESLCIDPYTQNRLTGSFILIDPESFATVGAGLIVDRMPDRKDHGGKYTELNLHREISQITRSDRENRFGGKAMTFWFTGLSGSGKSTVAKELESQLFAAGQNVFLLDGDALRSGLNSDLNFSASDRKENIRRAAYVARFLNEAGVTVLACFISPFAEDRQMAREIVGADDFYEIFMSASLDTCEKRDPHGLYRRARSGEIANFSGISSPFETPVQPDLSLDSGQFSISDLVKKAAEFYHLKQKH